MYRDDPITGARRLVAPGRSERLAGSTHGCPFCAGNEHLTPEQTGAVALGGEWSARSFPNRFPLTDPHEVIVPTPRHVTSWRALQLPELLAGLRLLLQRRAALQLPGRYVHAFINDGHDAGASIAHVHAQLVVLDRGAHTDQLVAHVRDRDRCALCSLQADPGCLLVERGRHHSLLAHPAPRIGGGLLLLPHLHELTPGPAHLAELAELVHRAWLSLEPGLGANMWIVADEERGAHWYVELQPRSANLAGVELATGLSVSAVEPSDSAALTRERLAMPAQGRA